MYAFSIYDCLTMPCETTFVELCLDFGAVKDTVLLALSTSDPIKTFRGASLTWNIGGSSGTESGMGHIEGRPRLDVEVSDISYPTRKFDHAVSVIDLEPSIAIRLRRRLRAAIQ